MYHWKVNENEIKKSQTGSQHSINPGQTMCVLAVDNSVIAGEYGTCYVYRREKRGAFKLVKDLEHDYDPEELMA